MNTKRSILFARFKRNTILALAASQIAIATPALSAYFQQTNLVTDDQAALASLGFTPASFVDTNLINPWGMSFGTGGPFWISNQGTSTSTLHTGTGAPVSLIVTIPQGEGMPTGPTGQVFAGGKGFNLSNGSEGIFFFANLDGSISGWNPAAGTNAVVVSKLTAEHPALYTGLALGSVGSNNYLYAANGASGAIDVFDQAFNLTTLSGNFVDPGPNPDGLVPFNIHNVNGHMYVTYAQAGPDPDEAPVGSGFVSEFDADGNFIRRFTTGGPLASPWGVALAPSSYGAFGGALLVGNFNDEHGTINAFSLDDGSFLGMLTDKNGDPVIIPYLWEITFGDGARDASPNALYFSAGVGDEEHGLFGNLSAIPEPAQWLMMITGFGLIGLAKRRRRRVRHVIV